MSKMSKEKRDKLILTWLCIIGVLGVLYTFVYGAQKDKLSEYGNGTKKAADLLDRSERLIRNAPIIERNLATNRIVLQQMQATMSPPGAEYYTFVKILKEFETKLGMTVMAQVATRSEPVREGLLPKFPYPETSISFTPSAHFHDVGKFIAEFENAYPFMRIASIRLHPEAVSRGPRSRTAGGAGDNEVNEKLGGEVKVTNFVKPNAS